MLFLANKTQPSSMFDWFAKVVYNGLKRENIMDIKEIYKSIREDKQLLETYDKINQKINFVIDHGLLHVEHVLGYIDLICDALEIDEKTRYLTFIAGMLHDVGRLESREEHSVYSAEFAKN